MRLSGRHKVVFLFGLAIGALFLWLAIRDVNFEELAESLASANFLFAIPLLLFFGMFFWLKAIRWAYLLEPTRAFSSRELFAPMMIGFAGNNVLPVRLGELLRVYLLGSKFRISKTLVLATLVLERIFDAVSILALLMLAITFSKIDSSDLSSARLFLAIATGIAVISVFVVVRTPSWLSDIGIRCSSFLPSTLARNLGQKIHQVRDGFGAVRSTRQIARVAANSLLQWALLAACIQFALHALDIDVPAVASVLVLGLVVAGISIPSAPGFVGTIELCFVIGLGFFGIGANEALAAAIFYHVLTFASVTGTGAILLSRFGTSYTELQDQAQSASHIKNQK